MITKTQFTIILLIVLVIIAGVYIGNIELEKYAGRIYNQGFTDGQIVLASQQFQNQAVVFSNGTAIRTLSFEKLCGGGE